MSSGISNFNPLTGLAYNNPEYPRIGNYSCNTCGGGHDCPCCAEFTGVVSRDGDCSTDLPVLFTNSVKYTPPTTAGGLIDILPATTADMVSTPGITGEQFLSGPNGLQLRATNTPASVVSDCVLTYKTATTNYAWEANSVIGGMIPIGGIIMGASPITAASFPIIQGGATWVLCDGGGIPATPDLRDKFIMCEGPTKPYGSAGGSATTTIASINLPVHCHLLGSETVPPTGGGLGTTPNITSGAGNQIPYIDSGGNYPGVANVPPMNFQPGTAGGSGAWGSIDARTASVVYGDDAGGNITATNSAITVLNPYYALYYMMRIS